MAGGSYDLDAARQRYYDMINAAGEELPTTAQPAAFYGGIQGAARESLGMAGAWAAIYETAVANRVSIPSDMFTAATNFYSNGVGLRRAADAFGRMSDDYAITSEAIGTLIYQRGAAELANVPALYHVRFEMTTSGALGEKTEWYNLDYGSFLPQTAGELRADVEAYAASLVDTGQSVTEGYGEDFGGIGAIEIGAY